MMRPALALLVTLVALPGPAAQPQSPETFKAGVTVIQVPVVVRDHDGHVVSNLGKDDFLLFDNGKRQAITSFAVESSGNQAAPDRSVPDPNAPTPQPAGGTAAVMPTRFVLYFFDDLTIRDPGDLSRIRTAAARQLSTLQPGDRVAIVTSSCRLTLDFTNDPAKLQEAVSKLELRPVPVCRVSTSQKLQLELLKSIVGKMSHLPARREIIVVSSGFYVGSDRSSEEEDLIETAVRSKVLIHAIDVGESPVSTRNLPADRGDPASMAGYANATNPLVLVELAHGTGGTYVTGSDYAVNFRKLATPESYYLLGFAPDAKADGRFHQLKVKLGNSGKLSVEARPGYYAPQRAE